MIKHGEYTRDGRYYAHIGRHTYCADLSLSRLDRYRDRGFICLDAYHKDRSLDENYEAHEALQKAAEEMELRYLNLIGRRLVRRGEELIASYEQILALPNETEEGDREGTKQFKRKAKALAKQYGDGRYVQCSPRETSQVQLMEQTDAGFQTTVSLSLDGMGALSVCCGFLGVEYGHFTLLGYRIPGNMFQAMMLYHKNNRYDIVREPEDRDAETESLCSFQLL